MPSRKVSVSRHLRRKPDSGVRQMRRSVDRLSELHTCPTCHQTADVNLKHVCYIAITDEDSQVLPDGEFQKGHCSIINVGPHDRRNPVARAVTAFHESLHTRDLAMYGEAAATRENEIKCHLETIEFIKAWQQMSKDENEQKWLAQELRDEERSIQTLREEA